MKSLLNDHRPLVFCPGCAHEKAVRALDMALQQSGLKGEDVALVTDIGCSGLFDTYFKTHAMHGLHGRALTYATGLKMAKPDLTVITIMGDGGLGIGGAHVLSSCRRNLDITLLVLNNFNYGMTGGQYSVTTPASASTSSGFLNHLEPPVDICRVAAAAGAPWVARVESQRKETLQDLLQQAIAYNGFSLLEVQGLCTGRYSRKNSSDTGKGLYERTEETFQGPIPENERYEYGESYRACANELESAPSLVQVKKEHAPATEKRCTILLLGAAGQRINTAGEVLCLAAMSAGMQVSQKNDYPITVLRGHSVSEVILSNTSIGYTGVSKPDVILALDQSGIDRRKASFGKMSETGVVLCASDVSLPGTPARVVEIDFAGTHKIASANRAMFSLAALVKESGVLSYTMLETALNYRFTGAKLEDAKKIVRRYSTVEAQKD